MAAAGFLAMVPLTSFATGDPVEGNGSAAVKTTKDTKEGPKVETMQVTAQRKTQNLQKVPVSDTAFSAAQIRNRQVVNTSDLLKFVPNVIALSGSGYSQANYYFRGIGVSDGFQTFDSPVATYLDDVVMGRVGGADSELLDLDRVEVLKGPQGTVFGRNTTGGAVLLYSVKPQDDFHFRAETAYGTHNQSDSRFMVNTPLTNTIDMRLSAFVFHNDGFQHDITTGGSNYGGQDNWGNRGAIRWRPNDNLEWNVAVDYSHVEGQLYVASTNPDFPNLWTQKQGILGNSLTALTTTMRDCSKGSSALDWAYNNCSDNLTTNLGLTSNLHWSINRALAIDFITGIRQDTQSYSTDFGRDSPFSTLKDLILATDSVFSQFSQEVKASGSLWNNFITYVGGLYFYREWDTTRFDTFLRFGNSLQATAADRVPGTNENVRNGTTSEAGYLQTDMHLLPKLTLTTGLRYTHDRKEIEVNENSIATGAAIYNTSQIAGEPVIGTYRFTPKVALTYQITPDVMVYGSYINGFKSGGWNGRASTALQLTSFNDEKAQSWELGWRSELFNHRIRFNGTFFWVNYNDLQLQSNYFAADGETESIFTNAGNSQARGIELESEAVVTNNLSINANLGLEQAKFTELAAGAVLAGLNTRSPVPFAPPVTFSAGATYNTPVPWVHGNVTMTGNFQWIPPYNTGAQSTSVDSSAQTVLSAAITYRPLASRWSVGVECTNCLFRYYVPIAAGAYDYISQPGYVGFRVRYAM